MDNNTTIIKITCQFGLVAKSTSTSMFQQPGNPAKLLSTVFIRVSEKYNAEQNAIMIMQTHPDHPLSKPLTKSAYAGIKT